MKRNRIVINFDNPVAAGVASSRRNTSSGGGVIRVLIVIVVLLIIVIGGVTAGGYLWWRHYQSTPAYSLAVLVDATQNNDQQAIDRILDTDKITADFVEQIRARAPAALGSSVDLTKLAAATKVKETLHDELVKQLQQMTDVAAGKPFVLIALAVPRFADIKQEGNTAHAAISLRDQQIELTMVQVGDYWRITAVQDEQLAKMIAQAMISSPLNGTGIQDQLQRQLNNLQNRNR